jgi:hypothetical protein
MATEHAQVEWSVRFVRFHGMRSRDGLFPAKPKIEPFLTDLAVPGHVAAATQNQALNALGLLAMCVLHHASEIAASRPGMGLAVCLPRPASFR